MHSKSDNIQFMLYDNSNEVFKSLLSRYQIGLETSMWGSDFIFDSVQVLYYKCHNYKCHKVNFKQGGSCIDSSDWLKKEKPAINPKHTNDNYFQYAVTVTLNYREIKWNPERVSNVKPFINKYNWKGINYPTKIDDWKTFEKNNQQLL